VAAGEAWLDPAVAKRLLAEFKGGHESVLAFLVPIGGVGKKAVEYLRQWRRRVFAGV
jgi:endonuclease III